MPSSVEALWGCRKAEWARGWADLYTVAVNYCALVAGNLAEGEIRAQAAHDRTLRELNRAVQNGRLRWLGDRQFLAYVRRRLTWRCRDELRRMRAQQGPPSEPLGGDDTLASGVADPEQQLLEREAADGRPDDDDNRAVSTGGASGTGPLEHDALSDPQRLAFLRRTCRATNLALIALIEGLEAYRSEHTWLSGPERSRFLLGKLGISRSALDWRLKRLRKLLGVNSMCPSRGRRKRLPGSKASQPAMLVLGPFAPRLVRRAGAEPALLRDEAAGFPDGGRRHVGA